MLGIRREPPRPGGGEAPLPRPPAHSQHSRASGPPPPPPPGGAPLGTAATQGGEARPPASGPAGPAATVRAMKPADVRAAGADIILGNTYHLMLRPGAERVARLGGLHKFMGWD
ncbi:tRNA-guanine transglycosylase, partial [Staphylococcus aureus]|uniref:tRNA-guanine transglycosylase n=1 Tax=Staphylococcus aureus TaxID=1280 RepID=UPI001F32AF67